MSIGIYIHIPFCVKKCPYCNFTSFTTEIVPIKEYINSVIKEMEVRRGEVSGRVDTIYFGGGTPSILAPEAVNHILSNVLKHFPAENPPEVTLEANPGTVDMDKLRGFRQAGVTRLSIGIQSFNDKLLAVLGRVHTGEQGLKTFEYARAAGFDNIGIDLIHSIPGESISECENELKETVRLRPEHISAYNLTVEEGTFFHCQQEKGLLSLPHEEVQVQMLLTTGDVLEKSGYEHYEVSNYALPGFRSKHNQVYWKGGEYLGLGVSAHSYSRNGFGIRRGNTSDLAKYVKLIDEKGRAFVEEERLTREKSMGEAVFLGLRMLEGVNLAEFKNRFGIGAEKAYKKEIEELEEKGLLKVENGYLRLTKKGLLLLNDVSVRFV